jgi:hypothetical protein
METAHFSGYNDQVKMDDPGSESDDEQAGFLSSKTQRFLLNGYSTRDLSIYRLLSPRTPDTDHEHSAPSGHLPTNRHQQGALQSLPKFGANERDVLWAKEYAQ